MKNRCLSLLIVGAFLFVLVFSFVGCSQDEPSEAAIRVMSFNIRTNIIFEFDKNNLWDNRKEFVVDTIEEYNADIIGMQEVKQEQYDYLVLNLLDYDSYGVLRSDANSAEMSPIFYRKSRYDLVSEETFWLSETPEVMSKGWDANYHRICSVVVLYDTIKDVEINIFNTHFDHIGLDARTNSAELIIDRIGDKEKVILMGDFNSDEESLAYSSITEDKMYDVKYLSPEDKRDSGGTFHNFGSSEQEQPIDFIFIDSAYKSFEYSIIKDEREGYYPSDHYPILSVIDYVE